MADKTVEILEKIAILDSYLRKIGVVLEDYKNTLISIVVHSTDEKSRKLALNVLKKHNDNGENNT